MEYELQALKNLITDRIHENHEKEITGVDLQEFLHDILDSLAGFTNLKIVSPAINYYVNQVLFNIATGALTLVRAGGITPTNISVDLDGRYRLLSKSDYRNDQLIIESGVQTVLFPSAFPDGTVYVIPPVSGLSADNDLLWRIAFDLTPAGFKINFDVPVTITYKASIKS